MGHKRWRTARRPHISQRCPPSRGIAVQLGFVQRCPSTQYLCLLHYRSLRPARQWRQRRPVDGVEQLPTAEPEPADDPILGPRASEAAEDRDADRRQQRMPPSIAASGSSSTDDRLWPVRWALRACVIGPTENVGMAIRATGANK